MKKTIRGKVYDTAESTVVKKITSGFYGDSYGYEETLYVTAEGSYFLYTNGGADSKYPTEKIAAKSKASAREWLDANS